MEESKNNERIEGDKEIENMVYRVEADQPFASVVKNSPANEGAAGDMGSIPGLGRFSGGGHGNPLWHSCLGNPMDRGAWQALVHGVTKSQI